MSVALDPAVVALREALEPRLEDLAEAATRMIVTEVPAYRDADERLRADVREHVLSHLRASLDSFGSDRDVTQEDLLFVRPHAARRAQRVSVSEFVRAFYVGERVLWDAALAIAQDDEARRAALLLASHLPRYFEVATAHAAEVYIEVEEQLAATAERTRRDLLEDLLAARPVDDGPRLEAARAAGLDRGGACAVVSARATGPSVDEQLLRSGAMALARAVGGASPPLTVVRQEEIVLIAPLRAPVREAFVQRLNEVQRRVAASGLPLAVGVSTAVPGLALVPDAYREATTARLAQGTKAGVVALPAMSAFEYLTLREDGTASRLIPDRIHRFLAEDMDRGAALIDTLWAYVAADLNVRRAAASLHIHVNTAHYRLARIAERTGCDVRRPSDLIELLIAARLADAAVRERSG